MLRQIFVTSAGSRVGALIEIDTTNCQEYKVRHGEVRPEGAESIFILPAGGFNVINLANRITAGFDPADGQILFFMIMADLIRAGLEAPTPIPA